MGAIQDWIKKIEDKKEHKKEQVKFAHKKRGELMDMVNSIQKPVNEAKKENTNLTTIHTNEKEIKGFVKDVLTKMISTTKPSPEVEKWNQNMLKSFDEFELPIYKDDKHKITGAVEIEYENGKAVGVKKYAALGKGETKDSIETTMQTIRGIFHEVAHSASLKHNLEYRQSGGTEASKEIGEIEAKSMERMFGLFMQKHITELEHDENGKILGLTDNEMLNEIEVLQTRDLLEFDHNAREIADDKKVNGDKEYAFRYIVGAVGADAYAEMYDKYPDTALNVMATYLKLDAKMTTDQAMYLASGGKLQTFGEARDRFCERMNNPAKVEKVDKFELEQCQIEKNIATVEENIKKSLHSKDAGKVPPEDGMSL
ncbi:MAG: hypothetical protein IKB06_02335 [Clostridia bacterium]|nr:hypothetical protein [Clostridia bacterium]